MAGDALLRVEIKNKKPVELLDLTASLMALGQSYEDFAVSRGFDPVAGNVKLYVRDLRTGSIIADLQAIMDQASFVFEHKAVFAGFLANFDDIVSYFLNLPRQTTESQPTRLEAERVAQVLEPVAKDGGAMLILQITGDVQFHQHLHQYTSQQANAVQNGVRRFLGPPLPQSQHFQREPMTLFQVRDDPRGQAGDKGVIERFSPRPVKLHFMTEEAKRAVLETPANPLRMIFFVDGEVSMAAGRPAIYKIQYVYEAVDKADLG